MFSNLVSVTNKFSDDQSIIFITFGGFGRYVLALLNAEFRRLEIPSNKALFLAFDTEKTNQDHTTYKLEEEYLILLKEFDGNGYIEKKENNSLKEAVRPILNNYRRDIEDANSFLPALGFVSFHKYDEPLIQRHVQQLIDKIQQQSPGERIKLVLISDMAGAVSNGMSVPFLYRNRNYLRKKQIRVEVFLATAEVYSGLPKPSQKKAERNCIAAAMLWEYAMAGRNGLTYPGKNGTVGVGMFDGKIADQVFVFSGGFSKTSLNYSAVASIMAQCICTLEFSNLKRCLSGNPSSNSFLEGQWQGKTGKLHPSGLMTMSVAGLKGDCLPQLYHFYLVQRFLEDITLSLGRDEKDSIKSEVLSWFLENNLNENEILDEFRMEPPELSPQAIIQESVNRNSGFKFLREKLDELDERAVRDLEKKKNHEAVALLIENIIAQLKRAGENILVTPNQYMKGALLFYEKAASLLSEKLSGVSNRILKLETDLFEENQQMVLQVLLNRLDGLSRRRNHAKDKAGTPDPDKSHILSLLTQIIETADDIQRENIDKYNLMLLHTIYQTLYDAVTELVENQKTSLFNYNKLLSVVARNTTDIIRTTRSAFTYNRVEFESLVQVILEKLHGHLDPNSTQEMVQKLGPKIIGETVSQENAFMETLLSASYPDVNAVSDCVRHLFCNEPRVVTYLQSCIDRFFLTLRLDRDLLPTIEARQLNFVMCTKRFYDIYKDTLFECFIHIETDNPFNIILSRYEDGFPFSAIRYMQRINHAYKDLKRIGESCGGHIMKELDVKLTELDA